MRDMLKYLLLNTTQNVIAHSSLLTGKDAQSESMVPLKSLDFLGTDLLKHILMFLKTSELAKVASVSKQFEKTSMLITWKSAAIYVDYSRMEDEDVPTGEHIVGLYPASDWVLENDLDEFMKEEEFDVSGTWQPPFVSFHEDDVDGVDGEEQEVNIIDSMRSRLIYCENLFLRGRLSYIWEIVRPQETLSPGLKMLAFRVDELFGIDCDYAIDLLDDIVSHCTSITTLQFHVSISWMSDVNLRTKFCNVLKKMRCLQEFSLSMSPWIEDGEFSSIQEFSRMLRESLTGAPIRQFSISSDEPGFFLRDVDKLAFEHKSTLQEFEVAKCDLSLTEIVEISEHCKLARLSLWDFADSSSANQDELVQTLLTNIGPTMRSFEFGPHRCLEFPVPMPLLRQINFIFFNRAWEDVMVQLNPFVPQLGEFRVCEADDIFAAELPAARVRPSFRDLVLHLPDSKVLMEISFTVESVDFIPPSSSECDFQEDVEFLEMILLKFPNIETLSIPDSSFSENSRFNLVKSFIKSRDRRNRKRSKPDVFELTEDVKRQRTE
eukprot:TRINITY_DN9911_c0_g1_i1.p1 TRINITY_DN9911_c0_g1~~TRINITY_DN9911_c0_g1_i1.p1  ORF type:complete len:605 (-),score=139.82 TRINITY_DN9911_c0_g1_i1:24-1667(-)